MTGEQLSFEGGYRVSKYQSEETKCSSALETLLWEEYNRAVQFHADPQSYHEAYGIITEEYKEFEAETFRRKIDRDRGKYIREALHVAVTALRAAGQALDGKFR